MAIQSNGSPFLFTAKLTKIRNDIDAFQPSIIANSSTFEIPCKKKTICQPLCLTLHM
jgi:hypothetical protein